MVNIKKRNMENIRKNILGELGKDYVNINKLEDIINDICKITPSFNKFKNFFYHNLNDKLKTNKDVVYTKISEKDKNGGSLYKLKNCIYDINAVKVGYIDENDKIILN